jgi:alkylhydroperoxidase/carboxymuconolactone decarboxylase family protein YurZ
MSTLSTWDASPPVKVGTHIIVDLIDQAGQHERLELDVVSDTAADFDAGLLGIGTPLGKALAGRRAGSTAPYVRGDLRAVAILQVTPTAEPVPTDAAARRQAALDKATHEVAKTNAQIFASTFEGKWGGYNPDGMDNWDVPNPTPIEQGRSTETTTMDRQQPLISSAFQTFMREAPQHAQAWGQMTQSLAAASALDSKTAALAYLAVLAALGMESGVPFHVQAAKNAGATKEEIVSAILVGLPAAGHRVTQVLPVAITAFAAE